MKSARILVVDDDRSPREALSILLTKEGHAVTTAPSGEEALAICAKGPPDLMLLDVKMPGMDGLEVLARVKAEDPHRMVLVMTAHGDWTKAVEAMRLGAYDYFEKPFDNADMLDTVRRALLRGGRLRGVSAGEVEATIERNLIGNDPALRRVRHVVRQVAPTDGTVLVHGESGTGKELVAHMVHRLSGRSAEPFVVLNCGSFTESLLESELFGHVQGAFTGATAGRVGVIEAADRGTLFLDEVGEMTAATQVKFLRVMQEREVKPVGGIETRRVDVRFVAATNRDLDEMVRAGHFRSDLFYRLNVIPIDLPPLRHRPGDVPALCGHFLDKYARAGGKVIRGFTAEAMAALVAHDWPGNVRELENVVQRAVAFCDRDVIGTDELGDRFAGSSGRGRGTDRTALPPDGLDLESHLTEIERDLIRQALERTDGHLTNAAKLLGMTFRSIRYKVKKYGLKGSKDE